MIILIIAIMVLIPGILLFFWINKRKFKRRNVAGLEGFSSYEKSLFIRILEGIGKWIAYALILVSLFLFLMYSLEKRQKEKNLKIDKTSIRSNH
jgi:uncharacterized membrane protein YsdA (DUF1294 family)